MTLPKLNIGADLGNHNFMYTADTSLVYLLLS